MPFDQLWRTRTEEIHQRSGQARISLHKRGKAHLQPQRHEILGQADIEKAFLQLGIRYVDRDACRFIWLNNPETAELNPIDHSELRIYRFCRVSFGLTVSPFLLNATLREHLALFDSDLARRIEENLYVDNIMFDAKPTEKLQDLVTQAKTIFEAAGMKLREFYGIYFQIFFNFLRVKNCN
ncbi:hypothetical protein niasHS_000052 [Heterodera schachtii]|uniref:Reverse transcriptase domain-containing protein n=1 Tax=Heterodera schachtii TaxID=97005 RepID=A0ABD2KMW6_HETSC